MEARFMSGANTHTRSKVPKIASAFFLCQTITFFMILRRSSYFDCSIAQCSKSQSCTTTTWLISQMQKGDEAERIVVLYSPIASCHRLIMHHNLLLYILSFSSACTPSMLRNTVLMNSTWQSGTWRLSSIGGRLKCRHGAQKKVR